MTRIRLAVLLVAVAALAACSTGTAATWTFTPIAAPSPGPVTSPASSDAAAANTISLSEWKVDVAGTAKAGKTTFKISNALPQHLAIGLPPGTSLFVCNLPRHFKACMFPVVTVTK
jgi:hypothetical protein